MVEPVLKVKKLSASATLPVRGSAQAAGYDLSSAVDVVIPARGKGIVPTNLVSCLCGDILKLTFACGSPSCAPRAHMAELHHVRD